jgi:hypothetical protein
MLESFAIAIGYVGGDKAEMDCGHSRLAAANGPATYTDRGNNLLDASHLAAMRDSSLRAGPCFGHVLACWTVMGSQYLGVLSDLFVCQQHGQ